VQTSTTLIYRVKAMEPEAWRRFVHLYGPLVYRWCRHAGLRDDDAADVGQDVFQAVARKIAGFSHDRPGATLRGWLWRITKNKVADAARGKLPGAEPVGGTDGLTVVNNLPAPDPGEADDPRTPDPEEDRILLRRALDLILDTFSDESRRAFHMVVVEGRPAADAARELGLTVNAVYLAKSRIKKRLKAEFDGVLDL